MDYQEFKRHIGKASLNTKTFAELIGVQQSSITNYAKKGEVPNHLAIIACLMGEMAENRLDFKSKIKNLELKEPTKRPSAFGWNKKKDENSEN